MTEFASSSPFHEKDRFDFFGCIPVAFRDLTANYDAFLVYDASERRFNDVEMGDLGNEVYYLAYQEACLPWISS